MRRDLNLRGFAEETGLPAPVFPFQTCFPTSWRAGNPETLDPWQQAPLLEPALPGRGNNSSALDMFTLFHIPLESR